MKIFPFFFCCFFTVCAFSQNAWQVLSPKPTGINLTGISLISETDWWIAGQQGEILRSQNAGLTWQQTISPSLFPTSIKMFNATEGWILQSGDTLYKTINGGASWDPVYVPSHTYGPAFFKNINELWVAGGGDSLLHSINGGLSWTADTFHVQEFAFNTTLSSLVFASDGIRRSDDGGSTWSLIFPGSPSPGLDLSSCSFPDSLTAYYSGFNWDSSSSSLYKSIDGGVTWSRMSNYPNQIYGGGKIIFFGNLKGIMLNPELNEYYLTHDGGVSWTQYQFPGSLPVTLLDYYNSTFAAVGKMGSLITSTDLGLSVVSLQERIIPEHILNSASFPDTLTGYIDVYNGGIYKTTDGGINWSKIDSSGSNSRDKIFFLSPQLGWMDGGSPQTIRISTDGGTTWTNSQPPHYNLLDFVFVSPTRGWAGDWSGRILSTYDGGLHWQTDTFPAVGDQYYSFSFSDSLNGWAAGGADNYNLKVWHTTDGGTHWEKKHEETNYNIIGTGYTINSTDANHAWIVGANKKIVYTSDGGNTWTDTIMFSSSNSMAAYTLYFSDTLMGYCGGSYLGADILLKSIDGGNTWFEILKNNGTKISEFCFVDSSHIWAVGNPSLIVKYGDEFQTGFNILKKNSGGFLLFPNPAADRIQFIAPPGADKNVEIIDLLGRVIKHIEAVILQNDVWTIDISFLTKGIYFLRVQGRLGEVDAKLIKY